MFRNAVAQDVIAHALAAPASGVHVYWHCEMVWNSKHALFVCLFVSFVQGKLYINLTLE